MAAGELSRERLQAIALATRRAKGYGVNGARWQAEARARAAEQGLGRGELKRLSGRSAAVANRPEVEIMRAAAERLSGPDGLTSQHNTFVRRHALAEIAGEFAEGASLTQLERATSGYLQQTSVVALGAIEGDRSFTTRDLLACERTIVDGAERRRSECVGVLHMALVDRGGADQVQGLSEEQMAAVAHVLGDGCGVSVLQALAGTGKTRVLGALARIYDGAGYQVVSVAPTGRAARELADAAGIPAMTIQRLLLEIDGCGGLGRQSVILLDEAGTAAGTSPSRATATPAGCCAWHYRHPPRRPSTGPDPSDRAWQAQIRLFHRHHHLAQQGKRSTVVTVAVARELAAFLWAEMTQQPARRETLAA